MSIFSNSNIIFSVAIYIGCVSLLGIISFAWDKYCAKQGYWRISEGTLLLIALVGGSLGSITGQYWFRHKTRKQPFKFYLHGIAVLQLVLLVSLSFEEGRDLASRLLAAVL